MKIQSIRKQVFNLLPDRIQGHVARTLSHAGFVRYLKNTGWLIAARIATFATSIITVAIVARYLGPDNLGKLSYAQSFVSIFSIFASLGIDQIIYRDLAANPERQNEILGTAVISKFLFGTLTLLASIFVSVLVDNEPILTLLIGIISFTFLLNPLGTVGIYFQAQVQARYTSLITIFTALFIPALKLLTIYFGGGIIYFASILVLESLVITLWSLYIYLTRFKLNPLHWVFTGKTFKGLVLDSWPFLFAGLFSYIYARIDQVMLQHYLNSAAVGIYDVAVKVSNASNFLPTITIAALFPAIVQAKKHDRSQYLRRYYSLTILVGATTLLTALCIFILARPIILILFGDAYAPSILLLRIYIWAGAIAIVGTLVQQYLITENLGWVHLILTAIGAVANIGLNLFLIPRYGVMGAAFATLFSYPIIPLGLLFLGRFREDLKFVFSKKPGDDSLHSTP